MYSVLLENGSEKKAAKGVVKSVINKQLKHDTYKNILESSGKMYSKMKVIRSSKHQLYTMKLIRCLFQLMMTNVGLRMTG